MARPYDPDRLITTTEAARFWKCGTAVISEGIRKGIIKGEKDEEGYWWLPASELQRIEIMPRCTPFRVRVRGEALPPFARDVEQGHLALDLEFQEKELAEV